LQQGAFPAAEAVGASIVSLPLFPDMQEGDLDRVEAALRKVLT
jgi:dTDP-4-amino-4,6-dideoxygalactose transaminase